MFHHQITSLTPAEAEEITTDLRLSGEIKLNLCSLETLPPDVAAVLGNHRGILDLDGLKEICSESAACLTSFIGPISLLGLTHVDEATAQALAHHSSLSLPPAVEAQVAPLRSPEMQQKVAKQQRESQAFSAGLRDMLSKQFGVDLGDG